MQHFVVKISAGFMPVNYKDRVTSVQLLFLLFITPDKVLGCIYYIVFATVKDMLSQINIQRNTQAVLNLLLSMFTSCFGFRFHLQPEFFAVSTAKGFVLQSWSFARYGKILAVF
jgi:hypothetical protein